MDAWVWCRGRGHQALCMQGQYSRGTMSNGSMVASSGNSAGAAAGEELSGSVAAEVCQHNPEYKWWH